MFESFYNYNSPLQVRHVGILRAELYAIFVPHHIKVALLQISDHTFLPKARRRENDHAYSSEAIPT
ncbi:hypothetical protein BGAL_0307g00180 [Botrytis galanthina]|uniref:Uncharacterized protein n=1 Tax=Botrytis galanthina TaxID=278940 RepID=A0A4S8R312_9HELO|nr:hypothetical protein BGAL_0307g00180 [Botrytis galanthina]